MGLRVRTNEYVTNGCSGSTVAVWSVYGSLSRLGEPSNTRAKSLSQIKATC